MPHISSGLTWPTGSPRRVASTAPICSTSTLVASSSTAISGRNDAGRALRELGVDEVLTDSYSDLLLGADEDFFANLLEAYERSWPRPRMVLTSFPHNPTTTKVDLGFFEQLVEFARAFPEIELDVAFSDRLVNLVEEGIDVAVRISRLRDSSLVAIPVGTVRRVVCARPEYLRRAGTLRDPQDVRAHTCVRHTGLTRGDWPFRVGRRTVAGRQHPDLVALVAERPSEAEHLSLHASGDDGLRLQRRASCGVDGEQDAFAIASVTRAQAATQSGAFAAEIIRATGDANHLRHPVARAVKRLQPFETGHPPGTLPMNLGLRPGDPASQRVDQPVGLSIPSGGFADGFDVAVHILQGGGIE